ncbi:MAG: ABC transporter permease [Caldilineales bacterium]|nr:ABC transporter permease [Caldilineales bacterium]
MTDALAQRRRSDRIDALKSSLLPFLGIFLFLVVWELIVNWLDIASYLLPKPTEIVAEIIDKYNLLWKHSLVTFYEMMAGYFLAIAVAVPLAIAVTASPTFDRFITPIILFFQTVPKIAIAPLFLVWFGVGPLPKVLVAFLISFFPILIDTSVGLRSVTPEMLDLARSMGASKMQFFTRFRLPTSLPYLFSGLKVAATLAVVGAVVGEFVGADKGLGYLLLVTNSNLQTALMFGVIVALTLQGLILFYAIQLLENVLIPWHVSVRSGQEFGTM